MTRATCASAADWTIPAGAVVMAAASPAPGTGWHAAARGWRGGCEGGRGGCEGGRFRREPRRWWDGSTHAVCGSATCEAVDFCWSLVRARAAPGLRPWASMIAAADRPCAWCCSCDPGDGCCSVYEECVSCCLSPSHGTSAMLSSTLRARGHAETGVWSSLFELCGGVCRTTSLSTQHENAYILPRKHCYSAQGRPHELPPVTPAPGVTVVTSPAGQSCEKSCTEHALGPCVPTAFPIVNTCDALRAAFVCEAGVRHVGGARARRACLRVGGRAAHRSWSCPRSRRRCFHETSVLNSPPRLSSPLPLPTRVQQQW